MNHTNRHNAVHPVQTTTPTKIRPLRRVCGLALAMIGLSASIASASTIAVTNGGFEDPTPHNPNNNTTADWTAGGWAFVGSPWTASPANYGRLSQGPVASPQLGNWIFNLNDSGSWIKQDLGTTVNAGDTVSVTFYVVSDTAPGQIAAAFLVGTGPTVYSQTFTNPQNNGAWVAYTLTQTIGTGVSGNLSLRFSNVSGRVWLDNVSAVTVTSGTVDPNAPTSTYAMLTAVEDTATALAAGNFGYADPNHVALAAVQITSLPALGTLKSGGSVVSSVPLTLAVADIGTLTYQPALNGNGTGYATLGIKVRNANNVWSTDDAVMTVNVTSVNDAPTSTGGSVTLQTDTVKTFAAADFRFADVDTGETLGAIQVVTSLPAHGTLKLGGTSLTTVPGAVISYDNIGTLTYTPNLGYTGADSFKFRVRDAAAFSADATMAITVTSVTSDILVSNGSFETPGPNGGAWATFGSPWSVTGSPSIYQQLQVVSGGAFTSTVAGGGTWSALINGDDVPITAPLVQNLGTSVAAGDTLSVTFWVGRQKDSAGGQGVAYFDVAGTKYTMAFDTALLPADSWQILTMTHTITNAGNLSLGFYGTSGHNLNAWVDKISNVSLMSGPLTITSFGSYGAAGVINQAIKTIALTVPYGTSLATVAPTYTLTSGSCNQTSGSPPSPTFAAANPAHYIVSDGILANDYVVTVSVTPVSVACDILAFGLPGNTAVISGINITLTVPIGTPVTNLAPTYTVSPFATGSPPSGTSRDFTNPQIYRITAQNGSTKDYTVTAQTYQAWSKSASFYILTDAAGANLPASASETDFPLLVRLNSGNFTFSQAQSDGRDIRFSTAAGAALLYQIEQWDAANSAAAVWVKIPAIIGNARQEIKMYWGKSDAVSESNGNAVFNAANGYASVLHLNETVADVVGNTTPTDAGTTLATGMIGKGRNFTAGKGILVGNNITTFPTGSNPHSTEVWFRSGVAGTNILGWGNEQGQGKVVMQYVSPPHINMDCYFGGAGVTGASTIEQSQWVHVAHTYKNGEAKIYVNGVLDGTNTSGSMAIPGTASMYVGGWYGYNYVGDMDEVRVSNVTRSANWIKLEYQNQNPLQTLVGSLVQDGSAFTAGPTPVTMNEGATTTLTGQAQGAQKVYWIRVQNGQETVLAVDRFSLDFPAGRINGNQSLVIRFKAVYPAETKTADLAVTIVDTIPDPVFTLTAPATWDGRQTITVTPDISNLAALRAAGGASCNYNWNVAGVAVTKQITPGILTLTRAQGSGPLAVTLVLDNGGTLVSSSKTITIQEPATDAWVQRTPGATEKPVTGQFIAADDTRKGRIYYNGTQAGATSVFLRVYKTESGSDVLHSSQTSSGGSYTFAAPIDAGLYNYKVVLSSSTGGPETVCDTVTDLVCGDAYIIDGQSNAVAYDYYNQAANYPDLGNYTSTWIRSFGTAEGGGGGDWGMANTAGHFIGMWGMAMAKNLLRNYNIPICIINGAVGGTRIDQHQANPADHYAAGSRYSIYANLITRVASAKLTHGIRGALWHQGEADLSNWGGGADWDYATYQQNFLDMSAAWKQDMPNLRYYYLFQVYAKGCGTSGTFTSDMLRDMQRTLPRFYSHMSIVPTLTYPTGVNCHFNIPDYEKMGLSMAPLVARDNYGLVPTADLTGPILQHAWFTTASKNEIALEFDQDMQWNAFATVNFFLDRIGGKVTAGSATGKIVKLLLNAASTNTTIDYVVDQFWDTNPGNLLYGTNEIAALSFYGVPIAASAPPPYGNWAADPAQGLTAGVNDGPADDPDHDGMTNQQEFAFGLNPSNGSSANPLAAPLNRATGRFQYTRRAGTGLTYRIFTSINLGAWAQDGGATEVAVTTSGDVQTVTVQVSTPPLGGKLFVRVQAQ